MPSSLTSGSSTIVSIQITDDRHWPSLWTKELGTPNSPAIRFTRGTVFAATLVRNCYGLSGCWPPCTDQTGLPANGGFYFQAFNGLVTLPVAGYDYNSVWTRLLAGLPPAGMAASLAALVQPCSSPARGPNWRGAPKTKEHVTSSSAGWGALEHPLSTQQLDLLDHLVGASEQRGRDVKSEYPRGGPSWLDHESHMFVPSGRPKLPSTQVRKPLAGRIAGRRRGGRGRIARRRRG
jgi:hypothetical protein